MDVDFEHLNEDRIKLQNDVDEMKKRVGLAEKDKETAQRKYQKEVLHVIVLLISKSWVTKGRELPRFFCSLYITMETWVSIVGFLYPPPPAVGGCSIGYPYVKNHYRLNAIHVFGFFISLVTFTSDGHPGE